MEKDFLTIFQNLTVLIAEDNIEQRDKLVEVISIFSDNLLVAQDGLEAYELYLEHRPNLIITDIQMPNLNGLQLTEKIRELDTKLPIIVLTAHTDKHLLLQAVSLHLINYLVKPITQDNLTESLRDAVNTIIEYSLLEVELQEGYTYNIVEKCVYKDGEKIKLSKKEIKFLNLLLKHKNQVVSKEEIEEELWSDDVMTVSALKNFVFKLRKKIGYDSLQTLSSNGFSLQVNN